MCAAKTAAAKKGAPSSGGKYTSSCGIAERESVCVEESSLFAEKLSPFWVATEAATYFAEEEETKELFCGLLFKL
jgi:hypothetical protein